MSAAVPTGAALARLLDGCAPLSAVPLCPEIRAFTARSVVEIWEAAEALAACELPAPFWAWPWAGGSALARVLLDRPGLVRGRRVLDLGCGGGVASFAAVIAGARVVIANDVDPWALEVARLAAARQRLTLPTLLHDYAADPSGIEAYDVILCSELAYDRSAEPLQRAALDRAAAAGACVLLADSGRTYFRGEGLRLLARHELPVPRDLEGVDVREARVYQRVD